MVVVVMLSISLYQLAGAEMLRHWHACIGVHLLADKF